MSSALDSYARSVKSHRNKKGRARKVLRGQVYKIAKRGWLQTHHYAWLPFLHLWTTFMTVIQHICRLIRNASMVHIYLTNLCTFTPLIQFHHYQLREIGSIFKWCAQMHSKYDIDDYMSHEEVLILHYDVYWIESDWKAFSLENHTPLWEIIWAYKMQKKSKVFSVGLWQ